MGLDVKIRIVGRKNGCEKWLSDAYDMYETRLEASNISIETIWHKNNDELIKGVQLDSSKEHSVVLLDVEGISMSSDEFSKSFYQKWLFVGGSRVAFVIGGADGLPLELKSKYPTSNKISLSAMTFTHQFARTMLVEQIYRASEIEKGSNYHK
jgi:23S rRNA (pseudouridine1915-N3)-methyltransferase